VPTVPRMRGLLQRVQTVWSLWCHLGPIHFWNEARERFLGYFPRKGEVSRHGEDLGSGKSFEVSVVVPIFNGGTDLQALLASIQAQQGCRVQTVLVDSGSQDGSRELVNRYSDVVWVDQSQVAFSHSEARNRGVSFAAYPLVFLTVQDAILPDQKWLHRLCSILDAEKLVALTASESPRPDADAYAVYCQAANDRGLGLTENGTAVYSSFRGTRQERFRAASIVNAACLYQKQWLESHPFEGNFGEDFLMGLRLVQSGQRVGKTAELRIVHSHTRPALYTLKRMFVSRRLMAALDLAESSQGWDEGACLQLVQGLVGLVGGMVTLERFDSGLVAWIRSMAIDSPPGNKPPSTLLAIVDEVEPYAPADPEGRSALILKALAGRLGWVLGGVDSSLWSTPGRKNAVEGLANGV